MQVKHGKYAMQLDVVNLINQLSFLAKKEIAEAKQVSERKES